MRKSSHPLMHLMVMLVLSLGLFLVSSVAFAALAAGSGVGGRMYNLWMEAAIQVVVFFLPVVLMTTIYYKGQAREYYRLRFGRNEWLMALAGVVATLLIIPLNDWLTVWNDSWDLGSVGAWLRRQQDSTEGMLDGILTDDTVGGLLTNLFVVALVPAVCEEVFFRAGIQNLLQRWLRNPHVAIWLTAIIFSLGHGEVFSFVPRFVLGALLGYLYVYSGSIVANSLAHFVNNALVVVMYWLSARGVLGFDPSEPMYFDWLPTVCCTIAAGGVMWVTFFSNKLKNSTV